MRTRNRRYVVIICLLITASSFVRDTVVRQGQWKTRDAFPHLTFENPVDFTHANDGSGRLFVLEQKGVIRVFKNDPGSKSAATFLDIKTRVSYGGEAGLLGLAFHPDFKNNGFFFLNYMRKTPQRLETVIARYKANVPGAEIADPDSETILFSFEQPYDNHNGGALKFGKDGLLYISTGDGGSWGDPNNNGQNKRSMLGKILRVDVNNTGKGYYGIPADNPFAGNKEGFTEEIYAYGLRNPWRISFDHETNTLWAGDVGQNKREEIDVIVKGGNYGWRRKESIDCYKPGKDCNESEFIDPILDMPQAHGEHSITGGLVYRGKKMPTLAGKYIFGDYVSGRIFALETKDGKVVRNEILADRVGSISAFGVDASNELYICDHGSGKILSLMK